MDVLRCVQIFLDKRWDQKSPLLLGYSGGPDSRALLDALLQLGVRPELAHVDHGWREESAAQAKALQKEAEELGLIFHTTRLEPDRREWAARQKRLEFFASLWKQGSFQALLLGHQADDWAETALKRTLEGAHLAFLGGMRAVSQLEGMVLWRPLLEVPRRDVLAYVEKRGLSVIQDLTNLDPSYLRARMRLEILPELASSFGKEISANLALLGKRAGELKEYLDRKTDEAFLELKKGPFGWVLPCFLSEPIEICHLLQRLKIPFTRTILDSLVDALGKRLANRRFGERFLADRGYFFYLPERMPQFGEPVTLREGVFFSGDWRIEVSSSIEKPSSWLDLLAGDFCVALPKGDYFLQMGARKWKNPHKVPAFLRPFLPHVYLRGQWVSDLFSSQEREGYRVRFSVFSNSLGLVT